MNSKGLDNDTPLHDAVNNSFQHIVELLLKHGANPLLSNKKGERPLDVAEDEDIRKLMQREVVSSDDSDSQADGKASCAISPPEKRKNAEPMKTPKTEAQTSSSSRELFKSEKKKKKMKLLNSEGKSNKNVFSLLKSSSSPSIDSDDSDSIPLSQRQNLPSKPSTHFNPPNSNGLNTKPLGKTPTLTATPVNSAPKAKLKTNLKKTEKNNKTFKAKSVSSPSKVKLSSSSYSSSDLSSDSEADLPKSSQPKSYTWNKEMTSHKNLNSSTAANDKKDYIKENSQLPSDNKSQTEHKVNHSQALPKSGQKTASPSVPVKRTKSHSSEEDSLVKTKSHKMSEGKGKTVLASHNLHVKANGRPASETSPVTRKVDAAETADKEAGRPSIKPEADESVYDFSLSTEDFGNTDGISLKRSSKAEELWDSLGLGTPKEERNGISEYNSNAGPAQKKSFTTVKQEYPTKTDNSNLQNQGKHQYKENSSALNKIPKLVTVADPIKTLQKTITKTVSPEEVSSSIPPKATTPLVTHPLKAELLKTNSTENKIELVVNRDTTGDEISVKSETKISESMPSKSDKKSKEDHTHPIPDDSLSVSSGKTAEQQPSHSDKSSAIAKKESIKKDGLNHTASDKHSAHDKPPDRNLKESNNFDKNSKLLAKKKKKHKQSKNIQEDTTKIMPNHGKPRSRKSSSEVSTLDVSESTSSNSFKDSNLSKSTPEKVHKTKSDSSKPNPVSVRKPLQDTKPPSSTSPLKIDGSRRKSIKSENADADTTKIPAKIVGASGQKMKTAEKQHSGMNSSLKKEKSEQKKITLLPDSKCAFLSELEKSSRQRDLEKRRHLKRKKKKLLQQQQKLKAQKSSESAIKEGERIMVESSTLPRSFSESKVNIGTPATGHFLPNTPLSSYSSDCNLQDHNVLHSSFSPHTIFKSPSQTGRSQSQIDENSCDRRLSDVWDPSDKPPARIHEHRHIAPVHRSLSFSGPSFEENTYHLSVRNSQTSANLPPHNRLPTFQEGEQAYLHMKTSSFIPVPNFHTTLKPVQPPLITKPMVESSLVSVPSEAWISAPVPVSAGCHLLHEGIGSNLPSNLVQTDPNFCISQIAVTTAVTLTAPNTIPCSIDVNPSSKTSATTQVLATEIETSVRVSQGEKSSSAVQTVVVPDESKEEVQKIADVLPPPENKDEDSVDASIPASAILSKVTETSAEEKSKDGTEATQSSMDENNNLPCIPEVIDEERERKLALDIYIKERLSKLEAVIDKPNPKKLPVYIPIGKLKCIEKKDPIMDRLNAYEEWVIIQRQIEEKRKKYAASVIPQAPQCYWEYMTFTGGYLLSGSRESWLSVPMLAPPPSLSDEMQAMFVEHEKERARLRLQHATQREKLIVCCEQEIMRVHSRAARTIQNQQIPLSACSVLLDREVYNVERRKKKGPGEGDNGTNRTAAIRDRFNARMFISWLQDVDDKYVKLKNVILNRQRHEAQALHAVQRTEWLLKSQEADKQGQQRWSAVKPEDITELHVPFVNISDDFDLLPA